VAGSTRAEVHLWTIEFLNGGVRASRDPSYSYRQLDNRDAPLRIEPLVSEVVDHVLAGLDSEKLKWLPDRSIVRILVSNSSLANSSKQSKVDARDLERRWIED